MEKSESVENLIQFVVDSVRQAHADDAPFHHLRFDRIFPNEFYAEMLEAMPVNEDYRAMSGKSKIGSSRADGKPTRTKIDLFPEYIRHLPPKKREVWDLAGRVLRSKELNAAFVQRLAPGLKGRFGENFANVNMYPVAILTRDIPGYRIFKHTDSLWKGITVQFYLPPDNSTPHIGTIFPQSRPASGKFCAQRVEQFKRDTTRVWRQLSNAVEIDATISGVLGFILYRRKIEARRRRTPSDIPVAACDRNYQ